MRKKRRFRWQGETERSISELVAEDGPMRAEAILPIIERLCSLFENPDENTGCLLVHPSAVFVNEYGEVRVLERKGGFQELAAYLPPEQDRAEPNAQTDKVYALGMLMLYMATGQEKKTEAEISLDNAGLLSLIRRCTAFDPMDRFDDVGYLHDAVKREMRAGRKVFSFLLYVLYAAALAALVYVGWLMGGANGAKTGDTAGYGPGYEEGFERGASAAAGITVNAPSFNSRSGSLPGNYSAGNGPTAAYSEKDVFFLANGEIIRMDAATGRMQSIGIVSGAYSLQYYQGSLYCCTPTQILRIDPETGKEEVFCDSLGGRLYIFEDVFYLYDSSDTHYLYRISKTGKDLTQITGATEYRCLNVAEGKLYYIDPDQENGICCSDIDGGNVRLISSSSYDSICVYDGKIYAGTANGLIRMDLNGGSPEKLTAAPAFFPNVSDSGVFFVSGSGRTLEWMSSNGRIRFTVVPTRTSVFQVAGKWILYQNEDDGGRLWKVRVGGADGERVSR